MAGELVHVGREVGIDRVYGQLEFAAEADTLVLLPSSGGVSFNISCILVFSALKLTEVFSCDI